MLEAQFLGQNRRDGAAVQATDKSFYSVLDQVLVDAKRGLDNPLCLSPLEIERICFAVAAVFSCRAEPYDARQT